MHLIKQRGSKHNTTYLGVGRTPAETAKVDY